MQDNTLSSSENGRLTLRIYKVWNWEVIENQDSSVAQSFLPYLLGNMVLQFFISIMHSSSLSWYSSSFYSNIPASPDLYSPVLQVDCLKLLLWLSSFPFQISLSQFLSHLCKGQYLWKILYFNNIYDSSALVSMFSRPCFQEQEFY